jgi:large subunit ribosomal protein L30
MAAASARRRTNQAQKETVKSLGLRKLNQVVEHQDTPSIRGMIFKVQHLVTVEEVNATQENAK